MKYLITALTMIFVPFSAQASCYSYNNYNGYGTHWQCSNAEQELQNLRNSISRQEQMLNNQNAEIEKLKRQHRGGQHDPARLTLPNVDFIYRY